MNELNQLGRCSDITLELGAQDLSNVKKEDLKNLASYALECVVSANEYAKICFTPVLV